MKRLLAFGLLLAGCAPVPPPAAAPNPHERLLTLDTHLDVPLHFGRPGWSFGDRHPPATDLVQVDLPRMEDGHLDGGFFTIYTAQGPLTPAGYAAALAFARGRSAEIDATLARFPSRIGTALTAADARRLDGEGKAIAFKSMENSYPLGESVTLLKEFYDGGVRLAGPVHGGNNQFADSATDTPRWNGLSPLGRQWLAEANRLGIVVDLSHASDAVFDQVLALSKAPVLLSHSGTKAIFDHPRNLDDDRLRKLAASGGAICFTTIYMSQLQLAGERGALFEQYENINRLTPAQQAELTAKWRQAEARQPLWNADFNRYMEGLLHVIRVAGPDHVCFGADWDGGGGLSDMPDISAHPRITERLVAAGYSEADIAKMWGGNVLRILERARQAAERNR